MNLDEYQQAWKAESAKTQVTIDVDALSKEVQQSQQNFQSMIFWRDVRESGTSLVLIPIWLVMGFAMSQPWTWYLSIPAFIWVAAFIVVDRQRHPQRPSAPGEPLGFYAKESLAQVEHQIWLLRNVLWWYLLPFSIPMLAYFLHLSWQMAGVWGFIPVAAIPSCIVFVVYRQIYRLNQTAVRDVLEPRRQDLLKLVASLEGETNSEDSGDIMELVAGLTDPARSGNVSWESWAENWNQIVPSWRTAAWIILPTLIGACCGLFSGLWLEIPEMGPPFFQAVVGAVIPFEIAFFWYIWRSWKKIRAGSAGSAKDALKESEAKDDHLEDDELREHASARSRADEVDEDAGFDAPSDAPTSAEIEYSGKAVARRTPKAPAMAIVILTLLIGILAIAAVLVFVIAAKGGSVPGIRSDDAAPFNQGEISNLEGWPSESTKQNSTTGNETAGRDDDQSLELATKLEELCHRHDVPAMTAAVVNTDGLISSACSGIRKRGTTDNVELPDRFPLGGCTASMTATLAATLVETGKIDWDTTIGDVWPQATDEDLHPKLRSVTLDELLSHQSGLPTDISDISRRAWGSFFAEQLAPPLERRRMLKLVLSQEPTRPQQKFARSNIGYAIASAMLETQAEESFESLMKRHVFIPLKMNSAHFHSLKSAAQLKPPLLWTHRASGVPVAPTAAGAENPTVYAAVGTVHLSIADFARYAHWHLAGRPAPLLKTQMAFDHLHEPQVDYVNGAKFACGWICSETQLGPALNHGGSNTNAFALIWVLPEADFAAVVCTNTGEPQAFAACDETMRHLIRQFAKSRSEPVKLTPEREARNSTQ